MTVFPGANATLGTRGTDHERSEWWGRTAVRRQRERAVTSRTKPLKELSLDEEAGGQEVIEDFLVGIRDVDRPVPYYEVACRGDRIDL